MTQNGSDTAPAVKPIWYGPLMVLGGGICIGFAPIGLRMGLEELGPQAIAFWRYVFALPILFAMVLLTQKRLPARPNIFVVIAGVCFALDIGLWHWALTFTSVAAATFIVNLGNICVGITAWIFLKERPTPIWGVAVLIAMVGAGALTLGGAPDATVVAEQVDTTRRSQTASLLDVILVYKGEILAFLAAIFVSCYIVASKVARRSLGGLDTIFWLTAVEIVTAFFMVLAFREGFLPSSLFGFMVPLFLALIVQIGGQGLIITGLGHTPASIAGVLIVVQPVVAALISWQMFGETLVAFQMGGCVLIIGGILLAQTGRRQSPQIVSQTSSKADTSVS